jgi:hypothetical protein
MKKYKDKPERIIIHHNGVYLLTEFLLKDIHELLGKYQAIGGLKWETECEFD